MEAKKTGVFIATRRKELHMTQKQMGEALGISDKTVSKWECGNGLPDMAVILPLCQLLEINVNELLSGEHLTQDTYHRKAEENMMNLMQDYENEKKGTVRQIVTASVWIIALFIIMFLPANISGMLELRTLGRYCDFPSLIEVLFVPVISLGFAGNLRDFGNGFRYLFREADSEKKLKDSIRAVSMAMKSMLACGAFFSILTTLHLLFTQDLSGNLATLGVHLAIALLTLLYSMLGVLLLIPVKARLEQR